MSIARHHPSAACIGAAGKRILDSIVESACRVHGYIPIILTLIGLVINIFAAVLFAKGMFIWAGLVVMFAGIFDMVDGEVARRTERVTKFGAFFDSVIDRYSDMVLLLGLVIWYAKMDKIFYAAPVRAFADRLDHDQLHARARGIADSCLQGGFLERPETDCAADHRRADQPAWRRAVGDGDPVQLDRLSAHLVHVAGDQETGAGVNRSTLKTVTAAWHSSECSILNTESEIPLLSFTFENLKSK